MKIIKDKWKPSGCEKPEGIHHNPDARAWAKFFVDTFPQHKHMEDVMVGWFANAMMAMYDFHFSEKREDRE